MFDKTNPTDLLALKNEVNLDPTGMDYAAASVLTKSLLELLNDPSKNIGGESINKPTEELDIPSIAGVVVEAEYAALSEYDKEWVKMFINQASDVRLKPFQAKFQEVFGGTVTLTAALALRSKLASRAEVLFGVNTKISRADWIAARTS